MALEHNITILLSTYNGAKFIKQQLDSILQQDYSNWQLIIRDDGSTDNTLDILQEYVNKDNRILVMEDNYGNVGAVRSFGVLLEWAKQHDSQYILFCDQDDVWLPNKISLSLKKIKEMEKQYGNIPLLVHSDLKVVDENLNVVYPSFLKQQQRQGKYAKPLDILLIQNFVTGCTVIFNQALLDIASPIPENIYMHDWWLALVAATYGRIGFIKTTTVLYRQHAGNVVGSKGYWCRLKSFFKSPKKRILITIKQAQALQAGNNKTIQTYANILHLKRFARIKFLQQLDWPIPWYKKFVLMSVIFLLKDK